MSEWQWVEPAALTIVNWVVPFVIGLLFRKRVGRWLSTAKMRFLNDTISIGLISIRSYLPTQINSCNHQIYENIKAKISGTKLINLFSNGLRISLPDVGNIKILIESVTDQEEEHEENEEEEEHQVTGVKVVVTPESPLRFGVRDVMQISEFSTNVEIILSEIERVCLSECQINSGTSYTIIEVPRVGHFREEKTFRKEDESLGTTVIATDEKITITVKTLSQIAKATKKYMLS